MEVYNRLIGAIQRLFAAFRFKDLQHFKTITIVLERNKLTPQDLIEYIDFIGENGLRHSPDIFQVAVREVDSIKTKMRRNCPECQVPMLIFKVNTTNCNQVGGSLTRQWICPKCKIEEFE